MPDSDRTHSSVDNDRQGPRNAVATIVVITTVTAYVALLGWHQLQVVDRQPVVILVAVLAALAVGYGWFGYSSLGTYTLVFTLTIIWSTDAATDPHVDGANMWPIGATMLAGLTTAGAIVAACLGQALRRALLGTRRNNGAP